LRAGDGASSGLINVLTEQIEPEAHRAYVGTDGVAHRNILGL
jgi:hypothetical protein